jgi:hypothetical protein
MLPARSKKIHPFQHLLESSNAFSPATVLLPTGTLRCRAAQNPQSPESGFLRGRGAFAAFNPVAQITFLGKTKVKSN